jgi:hypothetical protein
MMKKRMIKMTITRIARIPDLFMEVIVVGADVVSVAGTGGAVVVTVGVSKMTRFRTILWRLEEQAEVGNRRRITLLEVER